MKLSPRAIEDLRLVLRKSYGDNFDSVLTNEDVNEIGELLLNILAESLKIKSNLKY